MTELIGHLAAFFRSGMFPTIMGIVKIMAGSLSMKAFAAKVSIFALRAGKISIDREIDSHFLDVETTNESILVSGICCLFFLHVKPSHEILS